MPSTRNAKATKKQRAMTGLTTEEILFDLAERWRKARGDNKIRLGLELLPYFMPKLWAVDVTRTADVKVRITIGGMDGAV